MEGYYPWLKRRAYISNLHLWCTDLYPQLVEILFARGLVKILFATETFAMVRPTTPARFPIHLNCKIGC